MSKSLLVLFVFSAVFIMFSCQIDNIPENIAEPENSDSPLVTNDQERSTIYVYHMIEKQYGAHYNDGYNVTNYTYIPPTYYYNKNGYKGTLPLSYYYVILQNHIYGPIFLYTVQIFYEGYVSNN